MVMLDDVFGGNKLTESSLIRSNTMTLTAGQSPAFGSMRQEIVYQTA